MSPVYWPVGSCKFVTLLGTYEIIVYLLKVLKELLVAMRTLREACPGVSGWDQLVSSLQGDISVIRVLLQSSRGTADARREAERLLNDIDLFFNAQTGSAN